MQAPDGSTHVPVPTPATGDVIDTLFTYHKATPQQEGSYLRIREQAKLLVRAIDRECPAGPDRTAAVRHVRDAVMTANASIATNNAQYR